MAYLYARNVCMYAHLFQCEGENWLILSPSSGNCINIAGRKFSVTNQEGKLPFECAGVVNIISEKKWRFDTTPFSFRLPCWENENITWNWS